MIHFALHRSIFVRLLLIYGSTFIILTGGLFAIFSRGGQRGQVFRENILYYTQLLAQDIGTPPDLKKAAELHRKLGFDIAIQGPDLDWVSRPAFGEKVRQEGSAVRRRQGPGPFAMRHTIVRVERPPYVFFLGGLHAEEDFSPATFFGALLLIGGVLSLSFLLVRYILRPLRAMESTAQAFGQGDWKRRVPVHGRDELASLSQTLNEMADRIEGYILSMQKLLLAISHEFRSPLTRMKVALEFVRNDSIRSSLNEDIVLLDRMTEALLETERLRARPDSLKRENVSWIEFLRTLALPYPDLVLELPPEEATRPGNFDRSRMTIAIRNLIENALRHGGGNVHVRLRQSAQETHIEVLDRGPGIPDEQLAHLGEPFFRADPARVQQGGFGLGLSLVYAIVQAHQGRVVVERREGGGTCFRICL
ncbi:ATP-binding protein [Oligoflexus tunisiensis]|uniref:ATP-binding protein n=1 Tax=Oligoflexus tunisiensis TaxID=708132 RepID=UPI00114CC2C1|nr:ATP-binding protein [Oligoflexus tunisiensis]